jgi:hypothetical protein
MRSFCQRISAPTSDPSLTSRENPLVLVSEEPTLVGEPESTGGGATHEASPRMTPSVPPSPGDKSPRAEGKKKKKGAQIADRHPKPHKRGGGPPAAQSQAPKNYRLSPSATWESSRLSPSNGKIVLFVSRLSDPSRTCDRSTQVSNHPTDLL